MIGNERMTGYINSLDAGYPPYLETLEREARQAHVPIIRKETQSFLRAQLAAVRPGSILCGTICSTFTENNISKCYTLSHERY